MRFVDTLKNIWTIEELRKRILVTLLLVLVYRLGCYVVLPGISPSDIDALANFTNKSGLMQLLDMFSGGAFSQASIFALGIMPYITASIVIQLCGMILPSFQKMQREGFAARITVHLNKYPSFGTLNQNSLKVVINRGLPGRCYGILNGTRAFLNSYFHFFKIDLYVINPRANAPVNSNGG